MSPKQNTPPSERYQETIANATNSIKIIAYEEMGGHIVPVVERPFGHAAKPLESMIAIMQLVEATLGYLPPVIKIITPPGILNHLKSIKFIREKIEAIIEQLSGTTYLITDETLARDILNQGADTGPVQYEFGRILNPGGATAHNNNYQGSIFTPNYKDVDAEGNPIPLHHNLREVEDPMLMARPTLQALETLMSPMIKDIQKMLDAAERKPMDLNHFTDKLIRGLAAKMLFGGSTKPLTPEEEEALQILTKKALLAGLAGRLPFDKLEKFQELAFGVINREIDARIKKMNEVGYENFEPVDICDQLVKIHYGPEFRARHGDEEALNILQTSVSSTMFAFMDTTSVALGHGVRLLGFSPEFFAEVKQEVTNFYSAEKRYPQFKDLADKQSLQKLKATLHGLLTFVGATPGITRMLGNPVDWTNAEGNIAEMFGDASLENMLSLYFSLFAMERNKADIGLELSAMIENFLNGAEQVITLVDLTRRPAFGFIEGVIEELRRDCSGKNLAILQLFYMLFAIVMHVDEISIVKEGGPGSGGTAAFKDTTFTIKKDKEI